MSKQDERRKKALDKLSRELLDDEMRRTELQAQCYKVIPPSDETMRKSNERYNLLVNMGKIQPSECIF